MSIHRKLDPVLSVAPAVALLTLEEAKDHLRRDDDDDDGYIETLIAAVMSHLDGYEGILGRALINQTWVEKWSGFPAGDELRLSLKPVSSITSIEYYDSDNSLQTFAAANYNPFNDAHSASIELIDTANWPSTYDRRDAVILTGVFGYGATAAEVPAAIKHAAKMLLLHWYENREAVVVGTIATELPMGVSRLLTSYMRPKF